MSCPKCGAPLHLTDAHCPECGRSLAEIQDVRDRPLGITLLALYVAIWGLLALVMTLPVLVLASAAESRFFHPSEAVVLQALSLLLPVIGVLDLALAYGLWTRQRWAYPLAITLFIASPCLGLILWLAGPHGATQTLTTFGECGVGVAALLYLCSEQTRRYFGLGI